jgi:hypothetical protein
MSGIAANIARVVIAKHEKGVPVREQEPADGFQPGADVSLGQL